MNLRILGALLIVSSCGYYGISLAARDRKEAKTLRNLINITEYLSCQLQFKHLPLPALCRCAAETASGAVRQIFLSLADQLDNHLSPNVQSCMENVVGSVPGLSERTVAAAKLLGQSLGQFDLDGQLKGLESVKQEMELELKEFTAGQQERIRCYQTLGLCAGAAIAILII